MRFNLEALCTAVCHMHALPCILRGCSGALQAQPSIGVRFFSPCCIAHASSNLRLWTSKGFNIQVAIVGARWMGVCSATI